MSPIIASASVAVHYNKKEPDDKLRVGVVERWKSAIGIGVSWEKSTNLSYLRRQAIPRSVIDLGAYPKCSRRDDWQQTNWIPTRPFPRMLTGIALNHIDDHLGPWRRKIVLCLVFSFFYRHPPDWSMTCQNLKSTMLKPSYHGCWYSCGMFFTNQLPGKPYRLLIRPCLAGCWYNFSVVFMDLQESCTYQLPTRYYSLGNLRAMFVRLEIDYLCVNERTSFFQHQAGKYTLIVPRPIRLRLLGSLLWQ